MLLLHWKATGHLGAASKFDEAVSNNDNVDLVEGAAKIQSQPTNMKKYMMKRYMPNIAKIKRRIKRDYYAERSFQGKSQMYIRCMDAACIKQEGLPIRQSPRKRMLKLKGVEYHKVFHSKLPLRRRLKRAARLKHNNVPQNAVSFHLTGVGYFDPPVKHHRSAAAHVSTVIISSIQSDRAIK